MSKSFVELDKNINVEEMSISFKPERLPKISTVTKHANDGSMRYMIESLRNYIEDKNTNAN